MFLRRIKRIVAEQDMTVGRVGLILVADRYVLQNAVHRDEHYFWYSRKRARNGIIGLDYGLQRKAEPCEPCTCLAYEGAARRAQ